MREQNALINQGNPDLGNEFVTPNTATVCSVTSAAGRTPVNVAKHPVGRRKTYLQTKLKLSMDQLDKSADSDCEEDVFNSNKKIKTKFSDVKLANTFSKV